MCISFAKGVFTFHYVSIKTETDNNANTTFNLFTFHYVSIKTNMRVIILRLVSDLHSTMYLLKLKQLIMISHYQMNLHSTMYLLKLFTAASYFVVCAYLHSTMYLLKPVLPVIALAACLIYIPLCIY